MTLDSGVDPAGQRGTAERCDLDPHSFNEITQRIIGLVQGHFAHCGAVSVLIDGPSGAGKTSLAAELSRLLFRCVRSKDSSLAGDLNADTSSATTPAFDVQTVHLDDFYPGWGGLAEGSAMVASDVFSSEKPGFWRWDWKNNQRGQWHNIELDRTRRRCLIVEGVGAVTAANEKAAREFGGVIKVFLDGPVDERKKRALERDPEYAQWFDMWAEQESKHFGRLVDDDVQIDVVWCWN